MKKCFVVRFEDSDKIGGLNVDIKWPEKAMSFSQIVSFSPNSYDQIVTENPWIIACYPRDQVMVLKGNTFESPEFQTFGSSVNRITMSLLGRRETIPDLGVKKIEEFINRKLNDEKEKDELIKEIYKTLGDSVERVLLLNSILNKF